MMTEQEIRDKIAELKATEVKEPQDFYAISTEIDRLKNLLRQCDRQPDKPAQDCEGEEGCLMCGA
jgi:hypothetical protein